MDKDADQLREEIESARDRMSETFDALAYKADVRGRIKDVVVERVDKVKSAITGIVPDSGDVQLAASNAMEAARKARAGSAVPFIAGAAVGFALGLLLPGRRSGG